MTKEELQKEAEEKADIYFDSLDIDNGNVSDTPFSSYDVFVAYEKGALDFAEPREKRIAELEKENAELKEEKRINKWADLKGGLKVVHKKNLEMYDQLTKATEIIKKLYAVYYDPCVTKSDLKYRDELFAEIKQFLSEVEK